MISQWLDNTNSLFSIEVWSHADTLRHRTNNSLERINGKINRLLNKSNPNFYEVVTILKQMQINNGFEIERLIGGGAMKARKRIFIDSDKSIRNLLRLFNQGLISFIDLIDGLRRAIKLNI